MDASLETLVKAAILAWTDLGLIKLEQETKEWIVKAYKCGTIYRIDIQSKGGK